METSIVGTVISEMTAEGDRNAFLLLVGQSQLPCLAAFDYALPGLNPGDRVRVSGFQDTADEFFIVQQLERLPPQNN